MMQRDGSSSWPVSALHTELYAYELSWESTVKYRSAKVSFISLRITLPQIISGIYGGNYKLSTRVFYPIPLTRLSSFWLIGLCIVTKNV